MSAGKSRSNRTRPSDTNFANDRELNKNQNMKIRAKMTVQSVQTFTASENVTLTAVCGKYDEKGDSEDNTFARYTPSATLQMNISNPAINGQIKPGQTFYVDLTPVPEA